MKRAIPFVILLLFSAMSAVACRPPHRGYSSSSKIRIGLLSVNTAYSPMAVRNERIMERKACE